VPFINIIFTGYGNIWPVFCRGIGTAAGCGIRTNITKSKFRFDLKNKFEADSLFTIRSSLVSFPDDGEDLGLLIQKVDNALARTPNTAHSAIHWSSEMSKNDEPSSKIMTTSDYLFKNAKMIEIYSLLTGGADTDATVLIEGESGSGKDVLVKIIFERTQKYNKTLQSLDLTAIPETLFESELFGYEKGAFSGAIEAKPGKLELSRQGILVLDKIENLPIHLQVKLLSFLGKKQLVHIGGTELISIDTKIIVTCNEDLWALVKKKKFRDDLYYRLNVTNIKIPPLRERRDEILPLAEFFLKNFNSKYGYTLKNLDKQFVNFLDSNYWPGNVRELKNFIEKAVLLSDKNSGILEKLPASSTTGPFIGEVTNYSGGDEAIEKYSYLFNKLKKEKIFISLRQGEIIKLILKQGFINRKDIEIVFNISTKTANRDLEYLEKVGVIKRRGKSRSTAYFIEN